MQTFHLRSISPGSRNIVSYKSGYPDECQSFAIGGAREFFGLCPGRFTGPNGPGTVRAAPFPSRVDQQRRLLLEQQRR